MQMLPIKPINSPLYVITCISNPVRYKVRYHLYRQFEKYINDSGAILYTIEQSFGHREFEVTDPSNPHHIRVRTQSELWHKENLLNLLMQRLPDDWEYVAWIDADVMFARPDWVEETLQLLQHYSIIQMFSQASDLDPHTRLLNQRDGVIYGWRGDHCGPLKRRYGGNNHPGYAWAARRETIDLLGGLIDWGIVGSADWHMACGLVGQIEKSLYPALYDKCPVYVQWCEDWAERAKRLVRYNVGYMDGLILHYWHGRKQNRGYFDRWRIITENHFNPLVDLKRDWQGVWQLTDKNHRLRDELRAYFNSRDEDGTEL
jgi:hypothetical protein